MTPANLKSQKFNTNVTNDCTEQHLSHVWTEYDDFPSSEDLSAFLADLERDALSRQDEQTLPTLNSVKPNDPLPSVTTDAMTTEITTLKDVVCEMSRTSKAEDFTEFTDFPSSEDLDAFLADMELDCEGLPMGKSLTPRTTVPVASDVFLNKNSHCKREGSRSFVETEAFCHTELGRNISQEETKSPCRENCSSYSDKIILRDNDCSDSQFVRDCESVFAELTQNICNEDITTGRKPRQHLLKRVLLSSQRKGISRICCRKDINDISTKRSKFSCRSGSAEEFHEKVFVCNTPMRDSQTSMILSRVRNANEMEEDQLGSQTVDHHGNNEVSMLNDGCDVMSGTPFSPELFSQSLSVTEECCSKTPDLFSSPRMVNGESRSRCTEHSTTPDLFSSSRGFTVHTRSCTKEELNSVSLFSSSEFSYHYSASSPSTRAEQQASFPSPVHLAAYGNEAASPPNIGHRDVNNKLERNSLPLSFHSTPYCLSIPSKMLSRAWTPIQVSPLPASTRSNRYNDISLQGTPVLFSQLSNSSL